MISTVRLGSLGEAVRTLQSALNLCLDSDQFALVVDGFFGLSTNRRVREYQSTNDLAPDGVVGPVTWESLMPLVEQVLGNVASKTSEPEPANRIVLLHPRAGGATTSPARRATAAPRAWTATPSARLGATYGRARRA